MSAEAGRARKRRNVAIAVAGVAFLCTVLAALWLIQPDAKPSALSRVRIGITPYQDSALPVVGLRKGWYREVGLDVELVPLSWGDVVGALSGGAIDLAIYNFNSFLPPYPAASEGARKPIFVCPTYVFKGQAIMVMPSRVAAWAVSPTAPRSPEQVVRAASWLKGKRIGITKGTELEEIVRSALRRAGVDPDRDAVLVHASPEDNLAAFLAGSLDAFAAGLTERTEARRRGAKELLETSDVTLPVIDGFVTTREFLGAHRSAVDGVVSTWFRTVSYVGEDVKRNSVEIRDYLRSAASTVYSAEEYEIAWSFNVFATSPAEARRLFEGPSSPYYWRKSWDAVNGFLVREKKIRVPVPYEAYVGNETLRRLDGGT